MVYQQTCLIILFLAPIHQMYPYGVDAGDSIITFPSRTRCFRIGREKFDTGGIPLYDRRHRKLHVSHETESSQNFIISFKWEFK